MDPIADIAPFTKEKEKEEIMLTKLQRNKSSSRLWAPALTGALLLLALPLVAATLDDHEREMTAEVVAVDTKAGTLTVKAMDHEAGEVQEADEYEREKRAEKMKDKEMTLVIVETTQISEDGGNRIALADLEPGEFVNIVYESKADRMHAVEVERSSSE